MIRVIITQKDIPVKEIIKGESGYVVAVHRKLAQAGIPMKALDVVPLSKNLLKVERGSLIDKQLENGGIEYTWID
jgi:hypothetical protein